MGNTESKDLNVLVIPEGDIRASVKMYQAGQSQQRKASDGLAGYFRSTVMDAAEGDFEKGWKAFALAVRSLLKKGLEKDTAEWTEAESTARGILQNVRNRVRDLMPEREGSATDNAANTVRANVKKDNPRALLNSIITLVAALASREDTGDLNVNDLNPVITGLAAVKKNITETAKKAAESTEDAAE